MTILISPEFNIILDENYKLIGEARQDVAILDLGPVEKKVEEVELLGREIISSIDPSTAPLISSLKGREGVYRTAGILNNIVVGFLIGSLTFALGILIVVATSNPALLKSLFGG